MDPPTPARGEAMRRLILQMQRFTTGAIAKVLRPIYTEEP
jgi:hypothetical protein